MWMGNNTPWAVFAFIWSICQCIWQSCWRRRTKTKPDTQSCRKPSPGAPKDNVGNILPDTIDKLARWKEYIEQLFKDDRSKIPEQEPVVSGEKIEIKGVVQVIQNLKNGKAVGPDELHREVLKMLLKDKDTLTTTTEFFNKMYNTGVLPQDWLKSSFVTLPKKPNSSNCNDYRTTSLVTHILKIFLKIVHRRIY